MSIVLHDRKSFAIPITWCIQTLRLAARRLEIVWRKYLQASTLRRIDPETRADIGYYLDYV